MTQLFGSLLQAYVNKSGIPVQRLAKLSGIERTSLHKMISGERLPANKGVVDTICSVLMLTQQQAHKLQEQYLIAKMGVGVYARHSLVKTLFESFDKPVHVHSKWSPSNDNGKKEDATDVETIYGFDEVNQLIKAAVEAEASKENGVVKLIAQPEYHFLIDLLVHIGEEKCDLTVTHILCLQRNISDESENSYNLKLLTSIVPLLTASCNYQPLYYYDDVEAHLNNASMLPYLMITGDCVISMSYDHAYAIIFRSEKLLQFYSEVFEQLYKQTQPMLTRLGTPVDYVMHYRQPETVETLPGYAMFVEPCFGHFFTPELMEKYMVPEIPHKREILEWYTHEYLHNLSIMQAGCYRVSYFVAEGLDSFVQTGRVTEIPTEFYNSLDKRDCYSLMNTLYEQSLLGGYFPAIVNPHAFKLPRNLVIGAIAEDQISMFYIHPVRGAIAFAFHERSVSHAIYTFLEYLKDSDMVLPKDETLAIIHKKLDALEQELEQKNPALCR